MVRLVILVLSFLVFGIGAISCDSYGAAAVTATIDTKNIEWHNLSGYGFPSWNGFVVPVIVTPKEVPQSDVTYIVRLTSRDGYLYGAANYRDTLKWVAGEVATPKTIQFVIKSDDASASHVYQQLYADYQSSNLVTLRKDAENLLRVSVSKKTGP